MTSPLWSVVHHATEPAGLAGADRADGGDAAAPVVVTVHGSMDRGAAFAKIPGHLPDATVIRYDRRGYGRSLAAAGGWPSDLAGHRDDLLELIDGRPVVLAGHSLGGNIALAAAQAAPSAVRAVVVYEAPLAWESWWPSNSAGSTALADAAPDDTGEVAELFLRRMAGDDRWERLAPSVKANRRAEGAALVAELRSMRAGAPYDAGALAMPIVAARGSESKPHHRDAMAILTERCAHAELHEIAGAGHGAPISHPAEFAGLIRRAIALS